MVGPADLDNSNDEINGIPDAVWAQFAFPTYNDLIHAAILSEPPVIGADGKKHHAATLNSIYSFAERNGKMARKEHNIRQIISNKNWRIVVRDALYKCDRFERSLHCPNGWSLAPVWARSLPSSISIGSEGKSLPDAIGVRVIPEGELPPEIACASQISKRTKRRKTWGHASRKRNRREGSADGQSSNHNNYGSEGTFNSESDARSIERPESESSWVVTPDLSELPTLPPASPVTPAPPALCTDAIPDFPCTPNVFQTPPTPAEVETVVPTSSPSALMPAPSKSWSGGASSVNEPYPLRHMASSSDLALAVAAAQQNLSKMIPPFTFQCSGSDRSPRTQVAQTLGNGYLLCPPPSS
eukprot:Rmarinus@m.15263